MFPTIQVTQTTEPRKRPIPGEPLPFGAVFTDHMFSMDYVEGQGWINPRIEPFGPIMIEPTAMVFHYGQAVFEGLKAYRCPDGTINLFRPLLNFERLNQSDERLVIPWIDPEFCVHATKELVRLDSEWIPAGDGESLYIRPFVFATDPYLGVRPSETYRFMILLSPSGAYYPQGIDPVKIYVEDKYVRAVRGGTGFTKCAGNYAASLIAQDVAHKKGYVQVLWLDGVEQKYIEEVGSMNILFVIDGKLVTPELNGSILPGITRKSCIELARSLGMTVEEKRISIDEIIEAGKNGRLTESFGSGTAAVISPVGLLKYGDTEITINNNEIGPVARLFYDTITGVQKGVVEDKLGWITKV
ncbi:MAG: branched-chain amino acid aminotransferase [Oscillospiraceae bacterium]|nr:branched-chain amino acid aminotransferase [Oscillospiraceae bacterium]